MDYDADLLHRILTRTKRVAVVGASTNTIKASYFVVRYLDLRGFDVVPVNPVYAGQQIAGRVVHGSLSDIAEPVDMVDIFRRSDLVPPLVEEALDRFPKLQTIWMQIGVRHAKAAALAEARGVTVIQNRCPKIEYQRLFGELRWGGFNTGVISSRLPPN